MRGVEDLGGRDERGCEASELWAGLPLAILHRIKYETSNQMTTRHERKYA